MSKLSSLSLVRFFSSSDTHLDDLFFKREEKQEFRRIYLLPGQKDFEIEVTDTVKHIQIMLRLSGYLGANIEIDGVYSDFVMRAVQKFQKQFNREESSSLGSLGENSDLGALLDSSSEMLSLWPVLVEDGRMTPEIFKKMKAHLQEQATLFSKIWEKSPKDPLQHYNELAEMVTEFQVCSLFSSCSELFVNILLVLL